MNERLKTKWEVVWDKVCVGVVCTSSLFHGNSQCYLVDDSCGGIFDK